MDRLGKILEWCEFHNRINIKRRVRSPNGSGKPVAKRVMKWRIRHPHKVLAHKIAIDILIQPCEVCGSEDNIHRHHHNYSKPNDVIFLCKAHHVEMHKWDSF